MANVIENRRHFHPDAAQMSVGKDGHVYLVSTSGCHVTANATGVVARCDGFDARCVEAGASRFYLLRHSGIIDVVSPGGVVERSVTPPADSGVAIDLRVHEDAGGAPVFTVLVLDVAGGNHVRRLGRRDDGWGELWRRPTAVNPRSLELHRRGGWDVGDDGTLFLLEPGERAELRRLDRAGRPCAGLPLTPPLDAGARALRVHRDTLFVQVTGGPELFRSYRIADGRGTLVEAVTGEP
ncbi:hypothetical protein [Streptomyces sp. SAJ15]|uniref:hypothetical protein n=1 Tax=Streptomyces sp. SAJ15 TaxID=2011095 RepID=UPI001186DF36|nr:hypothetical protein [Streptomyces sp. SAJ15]TVL92520.1 hypothetical protein CD790_12690 [Streptomyces sp. SAJ15]